MALTRHITALPDRLMGNGTLGFFFVLLFWVAPIIFSIAAAVWIYNSVNRANATLAGIREELRRLGAALARDPDGI